MASEEGFLRFTLCFFKFAMFQKNAEQSTTHFSRAASNMAVCGPRTANPCVTSIYQKGQHTGFTAHKNDATVRVDISPALLELGYEGYGVLATRLIKKGQVITT